MCGPWSLQSDYIEPDHYSEEHCEAIILNHSFAGARPATFGHSGGLSRQASASLITMSAYIGRQSRLLTNTEYTVGKSYQDHRR